MVCGRGPSIGAKTKQALGDIEDAVKPFASEALGAVGTVLGGPVGGAIGGGIGGYIEEGNSNGILSGAIGGGISGGISGMMGGATGSFSDLFKGGGFKLSDIGQGISGIGETVSEFIKNPIDTIASKIPSLKDLGEMGIEKLKTEIGRIPENAGKAVMDILQNGSSDQIKQVKDGILGGLGLEDILGAALPVWQGGQNKNAAEDAAKAQVLGLNNAIESQEAAQQQLRSDLDPFREFGTSLIPSLTPKLTRDANIFDPKILQDPLLKTLQNDVTDRLTARNAASGKLGSGGTARSLQDALVPQAMNFAMAKEDQRQRQIDNLFRGVQVGNTAAGLTGQGTINSAGAVGSLQQQIGDVNAASIYGRNFGRQEQVGGLTSLFTPTARA